MKFNKKGQVMEHFGSLAIGVLTLSIILVITFLIMSQGKSSSIDMQSSTTYINITKHCANNSVETYSECVPDRDMVIDAVLNYSGVGAALLGSGNYSVSGNKLTINVTSGDVGYISDLPNVSYSCKLLDYAYNSTSTLQNATSTVPGWIPIIIITVIGSLLIGMVAFFRR